MLGPTGLSGVVLSIGSSFHKSQTGILYHISITILIGISGLFIVRQFILFVSDFDIFV